MYKMLRLIAAVTIGAALTTAVQAQERAGTITGTAVDANHNVLRGARIDLEPKVQSTSADADGRFTISNVAPGSYNVTVSFVGLLPFKQRVDVRAGEATTVDAMLQVAVNEQVVVTAARPHGEAQALNQQRTSDNIVQILPAEVITSLPNTNVADAVGRLPSVSLERDEGEGKYVQIRGTDPRLSNVTINGVNVPSPEGGVRNIKLDIIPSDIIGEIEVNKTLSANQDGDAIGGSVNLVTKSVGERPYASFSAMGGYTNIIGGRGLDQFTGTLGQRFGPDKKYGLLVGGSYDWNGRGIDDIEPAPGTNDFGHGPVPVVTGIDLREYRYYRTRVGAAGSFDDRLRNGGSAYIRGLFSNFQNYGDRWVYSPGAGDYLSPAQTDTNSSMAFNIQNRRPNEQIFSLAGGAKHNLQTWFLDYDLSFSRSRQNRLNQLTANFNGPGDVAFNIDTTDPYKPKFVPTNGVDIFDPTAYTLSSTQLSNDRTSQHNFSGAANVTRAYRSGSNLGLLEFGLKIRDANKAQTVNEQYFGATGSPDMTIAAVTGTFTNPNYYFGNYQLGPLADLDKVQAFLNANPGAIALQFDKTRQRSDPNNYDTTERVYAEYVMNTFDMGQSHLQAGLRLETTQSSYTGYHVTLDTNGHYLSTTPVGGSSNYTNALPSVQYRYAFDANTNVRASYGMGIARPNFGDLPPFILEQDKRQTVSVGNPDLKPTRANNFDLLFERFLEPVGVVQAGVFYKALTNPIFEGFQTIVPSGTFAGYTQSQPINGDSAHVSGVELTWQQHLSFLPGELSGLGVLANYSHTSSSAKVPGRSDQPALLRQGPNNWNLGITYDSHGISARLGITHNDASIFAYNYQDGADGGLTGPNGDLYLYPHTQVDAQASYALMRGVQVVVAILNINDEVFGFYQGSPQYPAQREFYNRTFSFALRLTR